MKNKFILVFPMLLILCCCTTLFAQSSDEVSARKVAEEYIKQAGISEHSVIPVSEQSSNITLDSKCYSLILFSDSQKLTSPADYAKSPQFYTFIALDNGKPATAVEVENKGAGTFQISSANEDPAFLSTSCDRFEKICDDKNYVIIDGGYHRYLFGTVEGKEVVMPISSNENAFADVIKDCPEYYSEKNKAILIPKDTFNELKQFVADGIKNGTLENKMGKPLVSHLIDMKQAKEQKLVLTIWLAAGSVFIVAAAITAAVIIKKKKRFKKAEL